MNNKDFLTYDVRYSKGALAKIVGQLERSTIGVDRDLKIMAALSMAIGLSDPTLLQNPDRFSNMLNNLSQYLCWAIQLPETIDDNEAH